MSRPGTSSTWNYWLFQIGIADNSKGMANYETLTEHEIGYKGTGRWEYNRTDRYTWR